MKKVKLGLRFSKHYWPLNLITTVCCGNLIRNYGLSSLSAALALKFIIYFIIVVHCNTYRKADIYYYRNFGISRTMLFAIGYTFDFLVFLTLIYFLVQCTF